MSKEIKSVRARPRNADIDQRLASIKGERGFKGALGDLKVIIYDEGTFGADKFIVAVVPMFTDFDKGLASIEYNYKKKDQYKDYTVDDFIKESIVAFAKRVVNQRGKKEDPQTFYEIIQDPWNDEPPKQRSYGFDKYVLNNSTSVLVKWFEAQDGSQLRVGGLKWANDDGSEREIEKGKTQSTKGLITKRIEIFGGEVKESKQYKGFKETSGPDDKFTWTKNNEFSKTGDEYEWSGLVKDVDIIDQIISYWKQKVVGYDKLNLCDVPYRTGSNYCDQVIYVSPLKPDVLVGPDVSTTPTGLSGPSGPSGPAGNTGGSASKIKMNISFPKEFKVIAREDVPDFQIYIGDEPPVEEPVEGFIFEDDEMTGLDPEYTEVPFIGEEELLANELDDAPDPYSSNYQGSTSTGSTGTSASTTTGTDQVGNVTVEKSPVGNGPAANSKLAKKIGSGYYIINSDKGLAGHRLINITKDLTKHLQANGYPGAKIWSNGIMRELKASTYPSNPDRAAGSLHGAGLAIDLGFTIPGYVWTNYATHNKNLAADPKLTKVIYNFVKDQGDLIWGASWDNSKPQEGMVKGRGITEYHHMEIRGKEIPKYWAPFKDEAAKLGIDVSKCTTTSGLKNAYIKIMESFGVTS